MQTSLDANNTFIMVKNSKEDQKLVLFGVVSDLNGGIYTNGNFKSFWSVTRVQHYFLREPEEVHDCISILHLGFLWETEVSRRADVCLFLNKATCQWTHSARCRKKTQNTCLFVLFHFKTTQSRCYFKEALLKRGSCITTALRDWTSSWIHLFCSNLF